VVPVIVRAKAKNGRIVYGRIYADTAKGATSSTSSSNTRHACLALTRE
jgi:hypothetical protein